VQHYRKGSHSVYDLKYHVVWITKYRKSVLHGQVADEVIMQYLESQDVEQRDDDFRITE
jgi:putative transposase